MNKEAFVELLKREGYGARINENNVVTVTVVGATHRDIFETWKKVKLIAQKYGYKHSIGVKNLEEANE